MMVDQDVSRRDAPVSPGGHWDDVSHFDQIKSGPIRQNLHFYFPKMSFESKNMSSLLATKRHLLNFSHSLHFL